MTTAVACHRRTPFPPLDTDLPSGASTARYIARNRNDDHSNPGPPSAQPLAPSPVDLQSYSHGSPSNALLPAPPLPPRPTSHITPIVTNVVFGRSNASSAPSPESPIAPSVPSKIPVHKPLKSVSILAPTDISPVQNSFSHSASAPGFSYRPSPTSPVASSDCAPAIPIPFTAQHPPHISLDRSLPGPFSSGPRNAGPSSMDAVTFNSSSMHSRRNRLHKSRPHPYSPSSPASPSVLGLWFSRAFGSGEAFSRHRRSSSSSSMDAGFYRPTRSLSDGSAKASLARPSPSSRGSGTTDSSCTTSSSSTSFSYASTTLTTPESTSPGLSPRNSTRVNKLQKKRPPMAPSAYQYPLGRHTATLGRSKSTPNGVGQRSPRNRIWSSAEEARHAAEEAYALEEREPSMSFPSTETSPTRRQALGPIMEVRRRTSSQALSDLACTGLCSTPAVATSSHLALHPHSIEDSSQLHVWGGDHEAQFDPYVECASQDAHSASGNRSRNPLPIPDSPSTPPRAGSLDSAPSASGFAVVNGYLDRSEDAMRRWTLAMADVPDEVLVHHLERLRKESAALARGRVPGRRSAAPSQVGHGDDDYASPDRRSSFFFGGPREMGICPRSPSRARFSVGHDERDDEVDDSDIETLSDEDDEEDWKTARQVLFCCRELVQTERNYQARLRDLASTELSPHFASLVARFVPALIRVSETMLAHLLDDPSAWGVSAAFIGCEEDLESALVAWSAVAGEFFIENLRPPKKLTKKIADDTLSNSGHDNSSSSISRVFRTRSQLGIPSSSRASRRFSTTMSDIGHGDTSSNSGHSSGMFTAALGTGLAFGLSVPEESEAKSSKPRSTSGLARVSTVSSGLGFSRAMNAWKRKSMPSSLSHIPSLTTMTPSSNSSPSSHHTRHLRVSSNQGGQSPSKRSSDRDKMSARDLAIQPTQRVMRYVLQYRDLLDHTPTTSPSRALVERAYGSALRIAKRCDRAQAHAAFLRQSSDGTKNKRLSTTA